MTGESKSDDAPEWIWAHILWQRHNLRMEDFADMPRQVQLAYIASEQLEFETPMYSGDKLVKAFTKKK